MDPIGVFLRTFGVGMLILFALVSAYGLGYQDAIHAETVKSGRKSAIGDFAFGTGYGWAGVISLGLAIATAIADAYRW